MLTSHGYYIPNTDGIMEGVAEEVAACGGPGMCEHCNLEVDRWNEHNPPGSEKKILEAYEVTPDTATILAQMTGSRQITEIDPFEPEKTYVGINLITLNGVVRVSEGDYIVKTQPGWYKKMTRAEYEAATS